MSIKNKQTLKELESILFKYTGEKDVLKLQLNNINKELSAKDKLIKNTIDRINQLKDNSIKPIVSEHALLRYFERVHKFDMNKIKEEIINDDVMKLINVLGKNGEYPSNDFTIVLKDNTVVTIK